VRVRGLARATAVPLDVRDEVALGSLVADHDLVVSLLPATEHVRVARACLAHRRHLATTSYISPEMQALDGKARAAGLTFLNECGLDPGLDHMSALRVIHDVASRGGKVVAFRSYCGGVPAPEADTNPLHYKFSWSPRGVLVAATSPARYRKDGEVFEVPGQELFARPEAVEVPGAGRFEGYPNRDSLPYAELYALENLETIFRGTLRRPGHCEAWYPWVRLGLLDPGARGDLKGMTYLEFMRGFAGGASEVREALAKRLGLAVDAPALAQLAWLGMFEEEPLAVERGGNLDVLCARMAERCAYAEGERDMIAMQHEFAAVFPDRTETIRSSLVAFGLPGGDSAMARTVSLPLAAATRRMIEGEVAQRGVIAPVRPEIYRPVLDELVTAGIEFEERVL
jgi:saccharopine dehydrogenase-like NADP-dependent oxidoreductase